MKSIQIKEYLLNLLESGQLKAGDRLPGARRLTSASGVSYTHVQTVVESLVQNGIFKTVPRSGTYVQDDWNRRILPSSFACHPCLQNDLGVFFRKQLPGVHFCRRFPDGVFELRVTHYLLSHHADYMDLSELLEDCFPDRESCFYRTVEPFVINGRLCGIPWIFSPRVLLYSRNVFRSAGVAFPKDGWSWNDFLSTVELLKRKIPANQIFDWQAALYYWVAPVVRAGGSLFDPAAPDPVRIDSPETIRGLELYTDLRRRLFSGNSEAMLSSSDYLSAFAGGHAAMMFAPRQTLFHLKQYPCAPDLEIGAVDLPTPEGGCRRSMFAADLFCIRKTCTDFRLARECAELLFSEAVQDYFGQRNYGIPFRRSSAQKALKLDNELDVKFLTEIPHMVSNYNIFSEGLYELVVEGISAICMLPTENVAEETHRLAEAIRFFHNVRKINHSPL